jgi:hypothetical protein
MSCVAVCLWVSEWVNWKQSLRLRRQWWTWLRVHLYINTTRRKDFHPLKMEVSGSHITVVPLPNIPVTNHKNYNERTTNRNAKNSIYSTKHDDNPSISLRYCCDSDKFFHGRATRMLVFKLGKRHACRGRNDVSRTMELWMRTGLECVCTSRV